MSASGILLVDKPAGWTSHDVVARVRRLANTRKVGHAGTLDPMATGMLVLGIGSATRLLTYLVGLDKEYMGTIRLGASTTTDDAEGELLHAGDVDALTELSDEAIAAAMEQFIGKIEQVPSSVSAIKVDGKRAYARVRGGEDVQLAAREVAVSAFELLASPRKRLDAAPASVDLEVRVACSSGTYIRALARDLGAALGVGGHLTALRRTRVGPFDVADAHPLDALEVGSASLTPAAAAKRLFGTLELTAQQADDLGHGKRISVEAADGGPLAAIAPEGGLIGLVRVERGTARPLVNFPPDDVADKQP